MAAMARGGQGFASVILANSLESGAPLNWTLHEWIARATVRGMPHEPQSFAEGLRSNASAALSSPWATASRRAGERGIRARRHAEATGQPRPALAAASKPDSGQRLGEPFCLTSTGHRHRGYAFREDPAAATSGVAEEAAHLQEQPYGAALPR